MSGNPLFTSFSVFYYSTLAINVTHSTWLELPLLMSTCLGTGQPFFSAFAVCGNISKVLWFSEIYQ